MPANPQKLQHTHTLFNGDRGQNYEWICDVGADAIGAARRALACLPSDIPIENLFGNMGSYHRFTQAVENRTVLDDGFSEIVTDVMACILIVPDHHPLYSPLQRFEKAIEDALNLSNRFLDLVAAHKARGQGLPFLDISNDPTQ